MKTIYKYPLAVADLQEFVMPGLDRLLTVQTQYGQPCLWALVTPGDPSVVVTLHTFGTGHPIPDVMTENAEYVGTYQLDGGNLVYHVFRVLPGA